MNTAFYERTSEVIGVLPVPPEIQEQAGISPYNAAIQDPAVRAKKRHANLARLQNTRKPILPIHTPAERELFQHLMNNSPIYMSRPMRWNAAAQEWNQRANTRDDVYYKVCLPRGLSSIGRVLMLSSSWLSNCNYTIPNGSVTQM